MISVRFPSTGIRSKAGRIFPDSLRAGTITEQLISLVIAGAVRGRAIKSSVAPKCLKTGKRTRNRLKNVDISNYNKLKIQNVLQEEIPKLIKYKFSVIFMQDKLWSQIPNMESWITEFIKLDRFGKLNG